MRISVKIRLAKEQDIPGILDLCALHSIYERAEFNGLSKSSKLQEDIFGESPKLYCLVAESNDVLVAYATYMKQYATWDVGEYIYMDCLFVREFARGMGIGERMVNRIKREGSKLGCELVQWQTPDFNTQAMRFYRRIGAHGKSKERFFLKI